MTSHLVQLGGYRAGIPLYWTLFLLIPELKFLNSFKKDIYFLLLENLVTYHQRRPLVMIFMIFVWVTKSLRYPAARKS